GQRRPPRVVEVRDRLDPGYGLPDAGEEPFDLEWIRHPGGIAEEDRLDPEVGVPAGEGEDGIDGHAALDRTAERGGGPPAHPQPGGSSPPADGRDLRLGFGHRPLDVRLIVRLRRGQDGLYRVRPEALVVVLETAVQPALVGDETEVLDPCPPGDAAE